MNLLHELYNELIGFSGLGPLLDMYHKGDYSPLKTVGGYLEPSLPSSHY
jgi:hypothetical protein